MATGFSNLRDFQVLCVRVWRIYRDLKLAKLLSKNIGKPERSFSLAKWLSYSEAGHFGPRSSAVGALVARSMQCDGYTMIASRTLHVLICSYRRTRSYSSC